MKSLGLSLIAFALTMQALPASAAEMGVTTFTIVAHDDNGYYWTLEGQTAHNPTIQVEPGKEITVTVKADAAATSLHNFAADKDSTGSDYVGKDGEASATYKFTAPASGTVPYYCVPHKSSGMAGTLSTSSTDATPPPKASPTVQVVGVTIAMLGVALLLRRK
jgi:plastocyanin